MKNLTLSSILFCLFCCSYQSLAQTPRFKVIAIAEKLEKGKGHQPFVDAAKLWLNQLALDSGFIVDYIETPTEVTDAFLSKYQLFIQLNYPPYMWSDTAKAAFEKYIKEGRGGWIGFHHATLLGEFDGYAMWPWFHEFMGKIRFKNYIATFAGGDVIVEDGHHPTMKNIPSHFIIPKEEWYTYDFSPRANVHVLATVNESSYTPASQIKMGDHPVIWTNLNVKARNIYIFMGHDPSLFDSEEYKKIFVNSISWAARK
jgi:uncharacterized protein